MGREVRRVPPNWQHPTCENERNGRVGPQPMYDQTYAEASKEWREGLAKWDAGERPSYFTAADHPADLDYWEYNGGPPDRAYYRPWADEEATWFQLWQTVSEGSPVSPPFATADELIAYLAANGDEWDQKRAADPQSCELFGITLGKPGWGTERAAAFVKAGWAPSMMIANGVILRSSEIPAALAKEPAT